MKTGLLDSGWLQRGCDAHNQEKAEAIAQICQAHTKPQHLSPFCAQPILAQFANPLLREGCDSRDLLSSLFRALSLYEASRTLSIQTVHEAV